MGHRNRERRSDCRYTLKDRLTSVYANSKKMQCPTTRKSGSASKQKKHHQVITTMYSPRQTKNYGINPTSKKHLLLVLGDGIDINPLPKRIFIGD